VRGDVALVGGGGDAREVAQYAVKLVLKLIMQSYEVASAPAGARSAMVALVVEQRAAALHVTSPYILFTSPLLYIRELLFDVAMPGMPRILAPEIVEIAV